MIRSIVRAVTLGAAALGAMCVAQAASATAFTYDFTNQRDQSASGYNGLSFSSKSDGQTLGLTAYAGHLNDPTNSAGLNSISAATLGLWQGYGMGVLYGNDNTGNGTHQVDNVGGGVDFIALSFSKAVTLSTIDRVAYGIDGYGKDSDASFLAYSGTLDSLAQNGVSMSSFSSLSSGDYTTGSSASSSVWLVAANVGKSDRDDGFKITDLKVTTANPAPPPAAVPEPATWAMMIVGFGAVGTGMRRRKAATPATA